jgi:glutaconate CoA-transferase, subunit A
VPLPFIRVAMPPRWLDIDAAAQLVPDNAILALGGMTIYRRPVGFVLALLRRQPRPKNLTLLCFTAGYESDLLIGAGCVAAIHSCYVGLEAFGFAPMFTEAAHAGRIRIVEETEASLSLGLRAAMSSLPWMPSRAWLGTDLERLRPDVRRLPPPDDDLLAFPALQPDIAVIHGLEADEEGSVRLNNNIGVDTELCAVSGTVIATVERRIAKIDPSCHDPIIPPPGISVLAAVPGGAAPTSLYPAYPVAGGEIMRYVDYCNAGRFDDYLAAVLSRGYPTPDI